MAHLVTIFFFAFVFCSNSDELKIIQKNENTSFEGKRSLSLITSAIYTMDSRQPLENVGYLRVLSASVFH